MNTTRNSGDFNTVPKIQLLSDENRQQFEMEERYNFLVDELADEFVEMDDFGNYVIKQQCPVPVATNAQILNTQYEQKTGRWSDDEHERFLEALLTFGKNWEEIRKHVGTRDIKNIRSHSQKFFLKLVKQLENKEDMEQNEVDEAEKFFSILNKKFVRDNEKYAPHNKGGSSKQAP